MSKNRTALKKLFELAVILRSAELAKEEGGEQEALEVLKDAATMLPKSALVAYDLGVLYSASGENAEAIKAYRKAIKLKPDFPEALNNLGLALAAIGKDKQAIKEFNRALAKKSDHTTALYNLGNALLNRRFQKDTQSEQAINEAIDKYQSAVTINPENPVFLYALARAYYLKGEFVKAEYGKAIQNFQKALGVKKQLEMKPDDEPKDASIFRYVGFAYYTMKEINPAISNLQKAIKLEPGDMDTYYYLGNAYFENSDYGQAIDSYEKARQLKSGNVELLISLGLAYYNSEQFKKAVEVFKEASTSKPDDSELVKYLDQARKQLDEEQKKADG